jgi:hypothetical protein
VGGKIGCLKVHSLQTRLITQEEFIALHSVIHESLKSYLMLAIINTLVKIYHMNELNNVSPLCLQSGKPNVFCSESDDLLKVKVLGQRRSVQ